MLSLQCFHIKFRGDLNCVLSFNLPNVSSTCSSMPSSCDDHLRNIYWKQRFPIAIIQVRRDSALFLKSSGMSICSLIASGRSSTQYTAFCHGPPTTLIWPFQVCGAHNCCCYCDPKNVFQQPYFCSEDVLPRCWISDYHTAPHSILLSRHCHEFAGWNLDVCPRCPGWATQWSPPGIALGPGPSSLVSDLASKKLNGSSSLR